MRLLKRVQFDQHGLNPLTLNVPSLFALDSQESPTSVVAYSEAHNVTNLEISALTKMIFGNQLAHVMETEYVLTSAELGRGRYGIIQECMNRFTGELSACKSIPKLKMHNAHPAIENNVQMEDIRREALLMNFVSGHPNIVQLKNVYEDSHYIHLILDICKGGNLFDLIMTRGRMGEHETVILFKKIVEAVSFCHSNGVVHRDIKPENILLESIESMVPKLCDFGQSAFISNGILATGLAGSPAYMAPEIICGLDYGTSVDIWSLGVLLYILLSGLLPFHGNTPIETFRYVLGYDLNLVAQPWDSISAEAKNLLRKMLARDPTQRITAQQILEDPWFCNFTGSNLSTSLSSEDCESLLMSGFEDSVVDFITDPDSFSFSNESNVDSDHGFSRISSVSSSEQMSESNSFVDFDCMDFIQHRTCDGDSVHLQSTSEANTEQSFHLLSPLPELDLCFTETQNIDFRL